MRLPPQASPLHVPKMRELWGNLSVGGQGDRFGLFALREGFIQNLDNLFHLLSHFMGGERQDDPFGCEAVPFESVIQQPNSFWGKADVGGEPDGDAASIPFYACDADLFAAEANAQDGQRLPNRPRWIAESVF